MNYIVLFDRDRRDEVFETVPGATAYERYAQLVREISEAEALPMRLLGLHDCEGLRDIFIVAVTFDGHYTELVTHLQELYDNVGVAGWFQVVGLGDNLAPLLSAL